jgi:hypothetical protein
MAVGAAYLAKKKAIGNMTEESTNPGSKDPGHNKNQERCSDIVHDKFEWEI